MFEFVKTAKKWLFYAKNGLFGVLNGLFMLKMAFLF
jgi:hypothetical protein